MQLKTYRHHRGGTYTLLLISINSTNGAKQGRSAIYVSHQTQEVHDRDWDQWCERVRWPDGVMRPRFSEENLAAPWHVDPDFFPKDSIHPNSGATLVMPPPGVPPHLIAQCDLAPKGWWCSRVKGHDGPCAARRLDTEETIPARPSKMRPP